MKKLLGILLALALMLCLSACGDFVSIMPGTEIGDAAVPGTENAEPGTETEETEFRETSLYEFIGWDDFAANYYSDTPVAMSLQYNAGTAGCISPVFDRASIIAVCDALKAMAVTGTTGEGDNGDERVITFTMADGLTRSITFDHGNLSLYTGDYTVTGGDEIWSMAFPAYSGDFDVFDLYFNAGVRAFADEFYENTPVSVGQRINSGAAITSTDPAVVTAVFEALAGATVNLVENSPDQYVDVTSVKDYVFTMEDGTVYTFSFAQQCLVVQVNALYGPVYYWLGNIDPLWEIVIEPEDTSGKFEGGEVRDLRTDFAEAVAIAEGTSDSELTIIGVHVSYNIDGQTGYLTLSDETAKDMVLAVADISVSGDIVQEPQGGAITVSVTLSDWSGPIFYFTGDTVQEVIGTNYACSSDDMSMLRSTILALAEEGNNDVEVDD